MNIIEKHLEDPERRIDWTPIAVDDNDMRTATGTADWIETTRLRGPGNLGKTHSRWARVRRKPVMTEVVEKSGTTDRRVFQ